MPSWHQQQSPVPLWHAELYTVVCQKGPNDFTSLMRFKDPVDAQRYLERIKADEPGSYVIPPNWGMPRADKRAG